MLKGAAAAAGVAGAAAFAGSETVFRNAPNAYSNELTPQPLPAARPGRMSAAHVDLGAAKYDAKGDGSDDSAALRSWRNDILAALENGASGVHATVPCGIFAFGPGVTLDILVDNVHLEGNGRGASVITQLKGVNADLVQTRGYHAGAGPTSRFSVSHLTLDGNGAEQSAPRWCCLIRGFAYDFDNVDLLHGSGGGLSSEFTDPGVKFMEARIRAVGCHEYTGVAGSSAPTYGILWAGPHDSQFSDVVLSTFAAGQSNTGPSYGFVQARGASAEYITNMHVWGRHDYGIWADPQANGIHLANVVAEGGFHANAVLSSASTWAGGEVYGTLGNDGMQTHETGISLGIAAGAPQAPQLPGTTDGFQCAGTIIDAVRAYNFVEPGACVDLSNSAGGNVLTMIGATAGGDAAKALYRGTPHENDEVFLSDMTSGARLVRRLDSVGS